MSVHAVHSRGRDDSETTCVLFKTLSRAERRDGEVFEYIVVFLRLLCFRSPWFQTYNVLGRIRITRVQLETR